MSRYSFSDSIRDHATLPLHFEPVPVELHVDKDKLDAEFDVLTEGLSKEEKAELSRRVNMKAIMYDRKRIHKVCEHIANHYRTKVEPNGYKGQVVCYDRECCLLYKEELDKLLGPNASTIVMDTNNDTARLTEDDIESLQDDYFKHGANILESCVEHQLISTDLMERYHLGALQKQEYFTEPDEFPNEPIRNLNALQNSINNAPLQRIIKEERTRIVDCIQQENGTTELFDKNYARREILRRYTPIGKNYCICQMCLKGKPNHLMEVNNLQSKPKFYWPEMRLALCLECSKNFEVLRSDVTWSHKFEQAILAVNCSIPSPAEVPIGNSTITFTQMHLAQIQMILRKKIF